MSTDSNNMMLSVLSLVWIWMKPILPKPLTYMQSSTKQYDLYVLIKLIRKEQKWYKHRTYKYIKDIDENEILLNQIYQYYCSFSLTELNLDTYLGLVNNDKDLKYIKKKIKSSKINLVNKELEYDVLEYKTSLIVKTITSLRACCFEMCDAPICLEY